MGEKEIKNQLKRLAKDFNFKFNEKWFNLIWISKEEEIFLEFLGDCKDPIYEKYGSTPKQRISNLNKFILSNDFKKCVKRYGGSPSSKKEILDFQKLVKGLPKSKTKIKLLSFTKRVLSKFGNKKTAALLTKTKIEKEHNDLINSILRHEWIHQLLFKNKIKAKKEKDWIYDEGLCTYFEYFLDNNLETLEKKRNKEKYPYEKQYYINAIKFREMLKDVEKSKQKKIIKDFYKSLKFFSP